MKVFLKKTISAQLHLFGLAFACLSLFVLLERVAESSSHFWASLIYGVTGIILFAVSSTYHFIHDGFGISKKWELRFENLDHLAIYSFVAACYTIILINIVSNPWANYLIGLAWFLALTGIAYTILKTKLPKWAQHRYTYTSLFVIMGWLMLIRMSEIYTNLSKQSLLIPFLLGALAYSIGAIIYATKWPKNLIPHFGFHEIWHVLVVVGYGLHFYVIVNFY